MNYEESFLGADCFRASKGYLALCVLIHHLYQFTGVFSGNVFGAGFLSALGRLSVDGFLFLSGFGLVASYRNKKDVYIHSFIKKRLVPFYGTYLFYCLLYLIFGFLFGNEITGKLILQTLTFGNTLISFGWYLQVTYLLYLLYYLCFRFAKGEKGKMVALGLASILLFAALYLYGYPYYGKVLIFMMGALAAYKREKVLSLMASYKWVVLCMGALGWFFFFALQYRRTIFGSHILNNTQAEYASILMDCFFILLFVGMLSLFYRREGRLFHNPVVKYLGDYSLELYVMQGMVLMLFYRLIPNLTIFALATVLVVLGLAKPLHLLTEMIKRKVVK